MAIQTPASPNGALDTAGTSSAIMDMVRDVVEPGTSGQDVNQSSSPESYDVYDLLGVEKTSTTDQGEPGPVPYDRFKEVNQKANDASSRLNRWNDVISEFESNGYNSAQDLQAAMRQREVQSQEDAIVSRYRDLEANDLIDPTTSQLQLQAELERFRYQQAMQQVSQYMVGQQKQTAYAQYPLARKNEAFVDQLIQRGMDAQEAASLVHAQVEQLTKSLAPELLARIQSGRTAPTPSGNAQSLNQPTAPTGNRATGNGGRSALSQLLGITRSRNNI